MAEIKTGQYNFNTLQTAKMPNVSQIYAQVGQQLNQMYYQNRQAHLQSIVNPLSQMKANKDDEKLLDDERALITERFKEFEEADNWHRATTLIYNTVEDITSNEALKAITDKYNQKQAYVQKVNESGWTQNVKSALIADSDYNSEAIVYDRENNRVTAGGFYGISFGEPIDIFDYTSKIADIASKIPASGFSRQDLSASNEIIQDFASVLEMDGETFISHYLESSYSQEGVSEASILNFAYNALYQNPKVVDYYTTIAKAQMFEKQFVPDKNNPRGGTKRPVTPQMLSDVFPQSKVLNSLSGANIQLSDIGSINKDGTFTINDKMSKETQDKLNTISLSTGYDIVDYLRKGSTNINEGTSLNILNSFLNDTFDNYIDGLFDNYLQSNHIAQDDPNRETYKQNWYEQIYTNNFVKSAIVGVSGSIADVMSWQRTKTGMNLVEKDSYNIALKEKFKRRGEELEKQKSVVPSSTANLGDIPIDALSTRAQQESLIRSGENIAKAQNEINDVGLSTDVYLSLNANGIPIQTGDLQSLLKLDFNSVIRNPKYGISEDMQNRIHKLMHHNNVILQERGNQNLFKNTVSEAYDILKDENLDIMGSGQDNFIVRNNITTYDEYLNRVESSQQVGNNRYQPIIGRSKTLGFISTGNRGFDEDAVRGNFKILTSEEFLETQSRILDKANAKSIKDTQKSLTYTSQSMILYDPDTQNQMWLDNGVQSMRDNAGDWVVDNVSAMKQFKNNIGTSLANSPELLQLLTTYSPRTSSGTISTPDKVGIDVKGLPAKVHSVDANLSFNSVKTNADGTKQQGVMFTLKDINGATLSTVTVSRPISADAYHQSLQNIHNNIRTYQTHNPEIVGENVLEQSLGQVASQFAQSAFQFNAIPGHEGSVNAANIAELQMKADALKIGNQPDGSSEKMYVSSPVRVPYTNQIIYNPYYEIEPVMHNGQKGFIVSMMQPDSNLQLRYNNILDLNAGEHNPILNSMGTTIEREDGGVNFYKSTTVFPNLTEAFKEISYKTLDLGYSAKYNYEQNINRKG